MLCKELNAFLVVDLQNLISTEVLMHNLKTQAKNIREILKVSVENNIRITVKVQSLSRQNHLHNTKIYTIR